MNKSVSSPNYSCASSEGPANAVDGSVGNNSKWCAGTSDGQYQLQIDLGSNVNIGRFVIKHAGAGGENSGFNTRAFTIDLRSDGGDWNTFVNVSDNTDDITTHTISNTQARYVRLTITNPQTLGYALAARIYEVEVYSS